MRVFHQKEWVSTFEEPANKKKRRQTKAAPGTPATGPRKQHLADAPLRERGPSTAFLGYKSPRGLRVAVFLEAQLDARESQIVSGPSRTAAMFGSPRK